jgi:ankyrin repeat protein
MKKIALVPLILLSFTGCLFSQITETLDERIAKSFIERLPKWKTINREKPFKPRSGAFSTSMEADLKNGSHHLKIRIEQRDSALKTSEDLRRWFSDSRAVAPPNRPISNLGEAAHLFETSRSVEIYFYKANLLATIYLDFTNPDEKPKVPHYVQTAPPSEINRALSLARVVADSIVGNRTFGLCNNTFYRPAMPPAQNAEEKLLAAVSGGDIDGLKTLIDLKANVNHIFPDNSTLLHAAVLHGCPETIKVLTAAGADLNARDKKGATPLMIAAQFSDVEAIKILTSAGADLLSKDNQGLNVVSYLVRSTGGRPYQEEITAREKTDLLKYLVERRADINAQAINGNTPLMFLIQTCYPFDGCQSLFKEFPNLGADLNLQNNDGETILIVTAKNGRFSEQRNDFIKLLLEKGAPINHRDKKGLSALDYILKERKIYAQNPDRSKELVKTIELLKNAGATE